MNIEGKNNSESASDNAPAQADQRSGEDKSPEHGQTGHVHGPNCNHAHHHHHHNQEPYVRTTPKVGRNDPCFCGSGKKYKKCCGGSR